MSAGFSMPVSAGERAARNATGGAFPHPGPARGRLVLLWDQSRGIAQKKTLKV
jgi:hypothetical protein